MRICKNYLSNLACILFTMGMKLISSIKIANFSNTMSNIQKKKKKSRLHNFINYIAHATDIKKKKTIERHANILRLYYYYH